MKLLVVLGVILILSPSIVIGGNYFRQGVLTSIKIVESSPFEMFMDLFKICNNESLILNFATSLSLTRGSIVSPSLKCITINVDNIVIKEGAFDEVPNLKYLNLKGNNIDGKNLFSFGNLSNVQILSLGDQNAEYFHDITIESNVYPELEHLNLNNNKIKRIMSKGVNPFPNLKYLDLSKNRISEFDLHIFPDTLRGINLIDNQLSRLDLSSYNLNNLSWLLLDNNAFESIGNEYNRLSLDGLEKLTNLTVESNKINSVSRQAFQNLINLRYLDLSNNDLSSQRFAIPEHLTALKFLALDGNSFQDVPTALPSNITTLSLNCNNISYLTGGSFYKLPNLSRLHLSGNVITGFGVDVFQKQALLEELYLDSNLLSYLPNDWCRSMKRLRYLNLSRNKFTSLDLVNYAFNLPLRELYLEHNPLKHINASTLQLMPKTMNIYLNLDSETDKVICKNSAEMDEPSHYMY